MVIHPIRSKPLVLFAFSILLSQLIPQGSSVSFKFNFSDSLVRNENITLQRDTVYDDVSISLTSDALEGKSEGRIGRATYYQPVLLWDENSGEVTNFTTKFSFLIKNASKYGYVADGFTFFLAPFPAELPPNANIGGELIGLYPINHILAVEFDTFPNDVDPIGLGCHVGIDINTINSISYVPINTPEGGCALVDSRMTAIIQYGSEQKLLSLHLWSDDNPEITYSLDQKVDISKVVPESCAIGFSSATGVYYEIHHIFSWSFDSTLEVKQHKRNKSRPIIGSIGAGIFLMFFLGGIITYCIKQKRSDRYARETRENDDKSIDYEFEKGRGPKRFTYSELVDSTNGFADSNKLGEGGFGSVYRGFLKDENIHIAVKRVSKESKQGKKEYISEVKTISRLRHRNLVQLVGWCHDHREFLLVYELMHNGSLDNHLYSKESHLTWSARHNIALGLGCALLYLHEEWEQCVVHRDIKPSNVMLDSSFNAKLGDFGLARLIDHHRDLETTIVAGTRGYIAPECVLGTANASIQSDVFSFGIVLLEITCGRRPIVPQHDQDKVSLLEWVWDLYGRNTLLDAVDGRLNGDFENQEVERFMVVGLWCAYPEKSFRPSIKQAMSVLQFQASLPVLPPKMPPPVYAAPIDPNLKLDTSSISNSTSLHTTSAKSAPIISSDTSALLPEQPNTT